MLVPATAIHERQQQSYTETDHIVDVYETITIKEAPADLFAGLATDPTNTTAPQDVCRPPGYQFTGIWAYSTETNGAHTPGKGLILLKCFLLKCAC
jgi:hypothetical protein